MELDEVQLRLRDDLAAFASGGQLITYSELARRHGIGINEGFHAQELVEHLVPICRFEHSHGRPLLSVVVVRADSLRPGLGFFKLAFQLGCIKGSWSDEVTQIRFFSDELTRAIEYWKPRVPPHKNREAYFPVESGVEEIRMIVEMLKHEELLKQNELDWIKKIDHTVSGFKDPKLTPRQSQVIREIFARFKARQG